MKVSKLRLSGQEEKRFEELKSSISDELQSLKGLDTNAKRDKNNDVKSIISHYINMTDKVEDRRGRIHTFTLQMLAIWVAAAAFWFALYTQYSDDIHRVIFGTVEAVFVGQILFCLYSAYVYEKQSGFRYVFIWPGMEEYGNTWKWFYYGSKEIQRIGTRAVKATKKFGDSVEPYLESFSELVRQYAEEDLDKEIVSNIQQLHLLRVHNYYKNRFYLQLTRIRQWSLYAIPITAGIGALIAFALCE